jgi:hypothetical protein
MSATGTALDALTEQGKLAQEADQRDKNVRRLWTDMQHNFYAIGEEAEVVYRKELFIFLADDREFVSDPDNPGKQIPNPAYKVLFATGDAWLAARIPEKGRSTVYRARKFFRELAIIPKEERLQIKRCNAPVMGQLSDEHKTDPKWIKRAQELPEKEFAETVRRELPEQHIDVKAPMKLNPSTSQRDVLERALEVAQWVQKLLDGPVDREHLLEYIVTVYLQSPCELEAFQGRTNEEAYDSQH